MSTNMFKTLSCKIFYFPLVTINAATKHFSVPIVRIYFGMQGWKMHCNLQESRKILHFLQISISAIFVPTLAPEKEL